MKKIFTICLIAISIICSANVFASDIAIYLNGTEIPPLPEQHQGAVVQEGVLYIPLRNVFEAMGAVVKYDGLSEEVSGGFGAMDYKTNVGSYTIIVNGKEYTLDQHNIKINNRVLVIPQAVVNCFGATVDWDDANNKVDITYVINEDEVYTVDLSERSDE